MNLFFLSFALPLSTRGLIFFNLLERMDGNYTERIFALSILMVEKNLEVIDILPLLKRTSSQQIKKKIH
jgi:hypothetical protein